MLLHPHNRAKVSSDRTVFALMPEQSKGHLRPRLRSRTWSAYALRLQRGLGLIEVMVSLLVVALALLAASQAGRASILAVERQRDLTLAHLCAHNALAQLRLSDPWPAVGISTQDCRQRGHDFSTTISVATTPNPSLRRVQVEVFAATQASATTDAPRIVSLVTLAGRY